MTENIRELTDVFTWCICSTLAVCLLHRSINSASSSWMQPRKSTLWSLFLGRPTAFCSWIRTSKSMRMWASCLSSGTRTNWGTAWLEETSASKPACMLGWFVIAWFRGKGPTRSVYTVHPLRTSREPDEGSRYSESWILRMCVFLFLILPVWCLRTHKFHRSSPADGSLLFTRSFMWYENSSPPKWDSFLPPLSRSFKSPVPNLSALWRVTGAGTTL